MCLCVPADVVRAEQLRLAGNAAFKAGQLRQALSQYKAAAALNPSDTLLYNNISLVLLKQGHLDEVGGVAGLIPSLLKQQGLRAQQLCLRIPF